MLTIIYAVENQNVASRRPTHLRPTHPTLHSRSPSLSLSPSRFKIIISSETSQPPVLPLVTHTPFPLSPPSPCHPSYPFPLSPPLLSPCHPTHFPLSPHPLPHVTPTPSPCHPSYPLPLVTPTPLPLSPPPPSPCHPHPLPLVTPPHSPCHPLLPSICHPLSPNQSIKSQLTNI